MFLSIPIINENGLFLIHRPHKSRAPEKYTFFYDSTGKSANWPSFEAQVMDFVKWRTSLLADHIIYLGSQKYAEIMTLIYIAVCPFNTSEIKGSKEDDEFMWASIKELPNMLQREELSLLPILQRFCLETGVGVKSVSKEMH